MSLVVLGIDPGTRVTGYGVIVTANGQVSCRDYDVIVPPKKASLAERALFISRQLEKLYQTHRPRHTAVEKMFLGRNPETAFKLGHIFALCLLKSQEYGSAFFEYPARFCEKKRHLLRAERTRNGPAGFVGNVFSLKEEKPLDATDALAVALCHIREQERLHIQKKTLGFAGMIGFLTGQALSLRANSVILETGGVGYEVSVSKTTLESIAQKEGRISLWIHTGFRQEALELYGFLSEEEKNLFLSLLKVKGVGFRMALSILGACRLEQFVLWIKEENIKALTALPRVGRKMAQQIVLTLQEQVSETFIGAGDKKPPQWKKVESALSGLGFSGMEIQEALQNIEWRDDLKKNLQEALTRLNKRK